MVLQRQLHTFIVRHTPPEGDIVTEDDLEGMHTEEAGFVAACFRAGMQRMQERFRRNIERVLEKMLPDADRLEVSTGIGNGVVELRVLCACEDHVVEPLTNRLGNLVPRVWDRVTNKGA